MHYTSYTPDQIALMLTEIEENRKALHKLRKLVNTAHKRLRKHQSQIEEGESEECVGDLLDDLGLRLEKMQKTLPAEPETK